MAPLVKGRQGSGFPMYPLWLEGRSSLSRAAVIQTNFMGFANGSLLKEEDAAPH
jgi:hypothetical protein